MRRKDREITDRDEIIRVIETCDVCRLGLADGDYPYIVPLNFGMREEEGQIVLYFHGAQTGRKYELMERNKKASFEMDCEHRVVMLEEEKNCTMEYACVMGTGRVELVPEEEKYDALSVLMAHYHQEKFPINEVILPKTRVFKLTVESYTGKRRKKVRECEKKEGILHD